jgi:cardiolipin synthase (CMP-forming)
MSGISVSRRPCAEARDSIHKSRSTHSYLPTVGAQRFRMSGPTSVQHQQRSISILISSWQQSLKQKSLNTALTHRNNSSTPNSNPDNIKPPEALTKATTKLRQQLQSITPHENIYTLPNILTFSRLLAAPAIGFFVVTAQPIYALSLFFYAGVTDLIDGWIARRYNSQTVVGTVIDPMADKTLMTICVLALGYTGQFPWWLVVIIFGRDVALAISAIYFRWISLPPPKTMRRYWDFSLPSAEVRPTEISKINTLLQLLLVGNAMVLPVLPGLLVESWNLVGVLEGWEVLVAGTTVWSGLSYIGNKDAVKILTKEERNGEMEETKVKGEKGDGKE